MYFFLPISIIEDDGEASINGDVYQRKDDVNFYCPVNQNDNGLVNKLHQEDEEPYAVDELIILHRACPMIPTMFLLMIMAIVAN